VERPVTFTLLPAVDVANGQAMRLVQGDGGTQAERRSPVEAALAWQADGAQWIHLVDLDAALYGGRFTLPDALEALHQIDARRS
jgi:phosphoribosyl isomerase A